jgi:hypothetical protein
VQQQLDPGAEQHIVDKAKQLVKAHHGKSREHAHQAGPGQQAPLKGQGPGLDFGRIVINRIVINRIMVCRIECSRFELSRILLQPGWIRWSVRAQIRAGLGIGQFRPGAGRLQ